MGRTRNFDDDTVVARAMEEFWTNGYSATSPAKLTVATGIAKGSLYNAFTSKRALFDKCLDYYHQQVGELAQEVLSQPGTTRDCLTTALRGVVDFDLEQPQRRGCLVGKTAVELAGHDPEIAAKLRRMQQRTIELFAARIKQGQQVGDVRGDLDVQVFAEHLATTLAGLRVMAMLQDRQMLYRAIDGALAGL
ncbi:MAG: TetR/AcrR family transcriptional regulator [Corynebacterium sp.]|nr:TetR/AcrR family transcriptional regulator [Corynebacterium sp.]